MAGNILTMIAVWTAVSLAVLTIACSTDVPPVPLPTPTSVATLSSIAATREPPTMAAAQPIPDTPTPTPPTVTPTATSAAVMVPPSPEAAQSSDGRMATQDIRKKEDRAILASDTATTDREESLVTIGVRYDGQNLGAAAPATGAVWSPDGTRFAYITGDGVSVKIGNLEGEESPVLDTGTEWHPMYQWPAWSPDGKLLAAINVAWCEVGMKVSSVEIIDALNGGSIDRHGPYDFWQADGTLQGPRRLSTPNNISWSRDGDKLLVSWDKAVVINVKSGKPRVISSRPVLAEWAPTSDAVYYFEIEIGEQNKRNRTLGAFYVNRLESDEPELLLSAEEVANTGLAAEWGPIPGVMSLSPSGSTLAMSGGGDEEGNSELHLFEIPEGSSDVFVEDGSRHPVDGRLVALDWAPDESGIAGLVADASGVRMDILNLSTNEWSVVTTSGIEVNQVQFLGKVISWSR